jgi:hypothetical protein
VPLSVAAFAFLAVAPVLANSGMSITIGSTATLVEPDKTTLNVPITVTCDNETTSFGPSTAASGTVTVTVTQNYKGTSVTGTGSTAITCTGQPQSYVVSVAAGSGTFHPGLATASASGSAQGTITNRICSSNGTITTCTYFQQNYVDTGTAGPQPITLRSPDGHS